MPDATAVNIDTQENEVQDKKPEEENTKNGNSSDVVSLDAVKIIGYRNSLRELRESILPKLSDELKEVKKACISAKEAIGELNGKNKKRRKPRKPRKPRKHNK